MKENLKKFLEEAGKNEELKAKLTAVTDPETAVEKTIEIAREYGFTLTQADFEPDKITELDEDEVDAVAGGALNLPQVGCPIVGVENELPHTCGCFVVGFATNCGCCFYGDGG